MDCIGADGGHGAGERSHGMNLFCSMHGCNSTAAYGFP
eukprot:SAG31_NODE_4784_length_2957_cov_1.573478_3_plen_38_part_00